jgi:hypothetical protein
LLDWLAWQLRVHQWDIKWFCRLLVTSQAYRRQSRAVGELIDRDPENRLLARGPRYRLPSWMIRDQALAVSGLLVRQIGGPPVFPYQPEGVWEEATFGNKKYTQDHGEKLYRRSLYTFWRRIIAPTMFFDSASRQVCSVRPSRTNSPLHALATMNDVTYVEAARALAAHVLLDRGVDADPSLLATDIFRRVLIRPPSQEELNILTRAFTRWENYYVQHPEAANRLVTVGEWPSPDISAVRLAAWTAVATTILNLDEALSKE